MILQVFWISVFTKLCSTVVVILRKFEDLPSWSCFVRSEDQVSLFVGYRNNPSFQIAIEAVENRNCFTNEILLCSAYRPQTWLTDLAGSPPNTNRFKRGHHIQPMQVTLTVCLKSRHSGKSKSSLGQQSTMNCLDLVAASQHWEAFMFEFL